MQFLTKAIPVSLACIALAACVSIDPRASNAAPLPGSTGNIRGAFLNDAVYRSRGEFLGHETLAEALRVPARQADTVYVWRVSNDVLVLRFLKMGALVTERRLALGKGFRADQAGALEIALETECGARDSPSFGCGWGTVSLFEDRDGDLNAVQTGGGAGFVGIIPMGIYAKHLSVFRRIGGALPLQEP